MNLSASQTRRRLKAFGHGVRKVHSAGRGQAVVIHTATGRHLAELQAKFADVGCGSAENDQGQRLENLPNLGPASAAWLRAAGVQTIRELRQLGPAAAYRLVRQRQPGVSLNLLWALVAGLEGRDWRELSAQAKETLRREIEER